MASQSCAGDLGFDTARVQGDQVGADPRRMANLIFAGVCGWIVLCVAAGAVVNHKGGRPDRMAPVAATQPASSADRTPI